MGDNILALSIVDKIIGTAPYMCEGSFPERIAYARRLGYSGVELNIADPSRLDIPALKRAAGADIRITAFGTGRAYVNDGVSLTDPNSEIRRTAAARLHEFLDIASEFQSMVIIGCIRGNIRTAGDRPRVLQMLGEAMVDIDAYAHRKGVDVVFDPINRYENNFLCTVAEVSDFIHKHHLTNTRILMDTFHMNIEEGDFVQSIEAYGDDVAYVHIADSNRKYPGCGHIDFPAIFSALARKKYRGPFCAECHARDDREAGCRAWLSAVRELMDTSCEGHGGRQETEQNN